MTSQQLAQRILCARARVDLQQSNLNMAKATSKPMMEQNTKRERADQAALIIVQHHSRA
jgi:hypothetical protein